MSSFNTRKRKHEQIKAEVDFLLDYTDEQLLNLLGPPSSLAMDHLLEDESLDNSTSMDFALSVQNEIKIETEESNSPRPLKRLKETTDLSSSQREVAFEESLDLQRILEFAERESEITLRQQTQAAERLLNLQRQDSNESLFLPIDEEEEEVREEEASLSKQQAQVTEESANLQHQDSNESLFLPIDEEEEEAREEEASPSKQQAQVTEESVNLQRQDSNESLSLLISEDEEEKESRLSRQQTQVFEESANLQHQDSNESLFLLISEDEEEKESHLIRQQTQVFEESDSDESGVSFFNGQQCQGSEESSFLRPQGSNESPSWTNTAGGEAEFFDSQQVQTPAESVNSEHQDYNESLSYKNTVEEEKEEEEMLFNDVQEPFYIPFEEAEDLYFFWLTEYHRPDGTLILFGKCYDKEKQDYASCSLQIENIQREMYILPREYKLDDNKDPSNEKVSLNEVREEIETILQSRQVKEYSFDVCRRKYAFGKSNIPSEADYLKLNYSYKSSQLSRAIQGKTFTSIFGTETGPLDQFLIKNKVKGPCWLQVKDHYDITKEANVYCTHNISVFTPSNVVVAKDPRILKISCPPLNIVSLKFETILDRVTQETEIVAASIYSEQNVDIHKQSSKSIKDGQRSSFIRLMKNTSFPEDILKRTKHERENNNHIITLEYTEKSLLQALVAKIHRLDPDIIVGHNFTTVYLDILLRRMRANDTLFWQKIGRLGFLKWPRFQFTPGTGVASFQERLVMSGRLLCDTFIASQDLIKSRSFHLSELASSLLKEERQDIREQDLAAFYKDEAGIVNLAEHCATDAYFAYAIMEKLQILPLTKQLTNLAGNLWSKSMNGNRLERNEYLLLHTFYEKGYVVPDRPEITKKRDISFISEEDLELDKAATKKHKGNDGKGTYVGGLVLEPKKGFYENYVLLLDFNSLYPSIIREFNVCFTTMHHQDDVFDPNYIPDTPEETVSTGVLPQLVKVFVEQRQKIKKLMKNKNLPESKRKQYDIEQLALKLTANSMYGCLGSSLSRFNATPLARYITTKGRDILKKTANLAISDGLDVIYGDTDSIMIHTNTSDIERAREIGESLKQKINKDYKLLEIDVDKCFKHTLLLMKKKYAALAIEEDPENEDEWVEKLEVKGLDLVRRDWCEVSHIVSRTVLEFILCDRSRKDVMQDIFNYLEFVKSHAESSGFKLEEFIIHKQLNKRIEDYSISARSPHVIVAKDMRKAGMPVRPGDTIPYVMCKDITTDTRPRMVEDVRSGRAVIDVEWYLRKQVLPPVLRLCSQMVGMDPKKIAECFAIDVTKLTEQDEIFEEDAPDEEEDEVDPELTPLSDDTGYVNMDPIEIYCSECKSLNMYSSPLDMYKENNTCSLICETCNATINMASATVQVITEYRSLIHQYYASGYQCNDAACDYTTTLPIDPTGSCPRYRCSGILVREVSPVSVYRRLCFLAYVFDANDTSIDVPIKRAIRDLLKASNFRYVSDVFAEMDVSE